MVLESGCCHWMNSGFGVHQYGLNERLGLGIWMYSPGKLIVFNFKCIGSVNNNIGWEVLGNTSGRGKHFRRENRVTAELVFGSDPTRCRPYTYCCIRMLADCEWNAVRVAWMLKKLALDIRVTDWAVHVIGLIQTFFFANLVCFIGVANVSEIWHMRSCVAVLVSLFTKFTDNTIGRTADRTTGCILFAQHRPCKLFDSLLHVQSNIDEERDAFATQAAQDWETILLHRARELATGATGFGQEPYMSSNAVHNKPVV